MARLASFRDGLRRNVSVFRPDRLHLARRRPTTHTMRREDGFTLIELLAVLIIIGILAVIAYTSFSLQVAKSHDAEAKQQVGNLVRYVEACGLERDDFRECDDAADIEPLGLTLGQDGGEVELRDVDKRAYVAVTHSRTGAEFRITRSANGSFRSCNPPGEGGCHPGAIW
jgi:prepilin-type N-terminal cleavage/methylation domain-containing protein